MQLTPLANSVATYSRQRRADYCIYAAFGAGSRCGELIAPELKASDFGWQARLIAALHMRA